VTTTKKSKKKKGKQSKKEGFSKSDAPFFFEQMEKQMSAWNEFVESKEGKEAAQAGLDFAQISSKHMADMFKRIGEALPQTLTSEEMFQKSREIYLICAKSYSEMYREAITTPSILKQNAKAVDSFLDWKIETDRINRDTLNNLGIPTKNDIDDIAERLYFLDKKMDRISKELGQVASQSKRSTKR
jgi:hypothetical protein